MPFDFNSIAASNLATTGFPGKECVTPVTVTSTFTSGTLNNANSTAVASLTIVGDGVSAVFLQFYCADIYCSTIPSNSQIAIRLYDGTIGTTLVAQSVWNMNPTNNLNLAVGPGILSYRAPAYSGSKTFNICLSNASATNCVAAIDAGAATPMLFRATWGG